MEISASEIFPPGSEIPWLHWKPLNCLRMGMGWSKVGMIRRGYKPDPTIRECWEEDNTRQHCLIGRLLFNQCSLKNLAWCNNNAKDCIKKKKTVENCCMTTCFKDHHCLICVTINIPLQMLGRKKCNTKRGNELISRTKGYRKWA